jgi:hypothetical protein
VLQLIEFWFVFRIELTKYSSKEGAHTGWAEEMLSEEGGTEFTDVGWCRGVRGGEDRSKA